MSRKDWRLFKLWVTVLVYGTLRDLITNLNWYYKLTSVEETDEYNGVGGLQPTDDADVVISFDVNCE
jgi:hypothetical protein